MTDPRQLELIQRILQVAAANEDDPRRFSSYAHAPFAFCTDILGVTLWAKQRAILEATLHHRRVVVRSGHGVGKTYAMACLTLWWLYGRQGLVVTTAPSKEHVEDVLWREIANLVMHARVKLPGEQFGTERRIDGTWYATGITTDKPEAFTGRHHPRLMAIIDEAPGVEEPTHLAISTLATGVENRIVMIGNPTVTSGAFYDACKTPKFWHGFKISCLDHPNVVAGKELIAGAVTQEWIEERRAKWGEHHPLWDSRVLGEFPKVSERGTVPLGWVERAQNEAKRLEAVATATELRIPRVGGLDVARYGDNVCVLFVRRGDAIEHWASWSHRSLTHTAGRAMEAIREWELKHLVVDAAGLGAGVVDMLMEQHAPVFAYNGGHRAFSPSMYANKRSELWWYIRQRLERERLWLPVDCTQLVEDLVAPQYELTSAGRIRVETKEKLLERGVPSPDFADALVECFAMDADPEAELEKPLGPGQDPTPTAVVLGTSTLAEWCGGLPDGF